MVDCCCSGELEFVGKLVASFRVVFSAAFHEFDEEPVEGALLVSFAEQA